MYGLTDFTLAKNQFISDLDLQITRPVTHLSAPTGRGKSTFIIDEFSKQHKVLFLCAVNVQVAQIASDYQDDVRVQCITNDGQFNTSSSRLSGQVVVCVYDKLAMLLDKFDNLDDYVLVIDEAHKVYQAAGYRRPAISVIIDAITNHVFSQVVTVSATFIPEIFPVKFDEQILISYQPEQKPSMAVSFYNKPELMMESLVQICPSAGKVAIVRINDKKKIKRAKVSFELQKLRVLEIHSENQKSEEVVRLLESSQIVDYDIVLTTSLLDEAINIKNDNIESVHVFQRLHLDELKQFIGRCRKSVPKVNLHILNSELERRKIDLASERAEIDSMCAISLSYALMLGKKTGNYTRAVKQVNATTKEHCGFEPLRYDYLANELPSIDDVAVLAKLYEVAMQVQYVNDDSLYQALLLSGCFSEITLHHGQAKPDEDTTNLLARASEVLEQEKQTAIDQCLLELGCSDDGDSDDGVSELTINDIAELAQAHEQSGVMGEIASSWKALCLVLPTEQALDVVRKDRQQQVWTFSKAVTTRLDYQPFFNKIKADVAANGQVALEGKDDINAYFITALREQAKLIPDFKDYIRSLNITGLQVQKNNKFKLSNRYLYSFIREFTDCEESRSGGVQTFIIKGIGLFGYDYNIRQLKRSSPKKPKRVFKFFKNDGDELPF